MNIGILFAGESYGTRGRDWHTNLRSLRQMIINPLSENNVVDLYFVTYQHEYEAELAQIMQAKKFLFLSRKESHAQVTYLKGLDLLQNQGKDFYVTTRWDIAFMRPVTALNIDYSKFNALFREWDHWNEKYQLACDNLFAFPSGYLNDFIDVVQSIRNDPPRGCPDMHDAYRMMRDRLGDNNVNFMVDEIYNSAYNPIYQLMRT